MVLLPCSMTLRANCPSLRWLTGIRASADLIRGKRPLTIAVVERDYPATIRALHFPGPLLDKLGNGSKGISWKTQDEVSSSANLNHVKLDGPAKAACASTAPSTPREVILSLAPETNGQWWRSKRQALGEFTGRDHTHLAITKKMRRFAFRDIPGSSAQNHLQSDPVRAGKRARLPTTPATQCP